MAVHLYPGYGGEFVSNLLLILVFSSRKIDWIYHICTVVLFDVDPSSIKEQPLIAKKGSSVRVTPKQLPLM